MINIRPLLTDKTPLLILLIVGLCACNQPLEVTPLPNPIFDEATQQYLQHTELVNLSEILQSKSLHRFDENTITLNPYWPSVSMSFQQCIHDANCYYSITQTGIPVQHFPANENVYYWWHNRLTQPEQAQVCGIEFLNEEKTQYRLQTFANQQTLEATEGYFVTHYQACGTCSSLQDLAVYGTLDLTVMAKTCSKRSSFVAKKTCMQEIGFSEACAESWAYNAAKTAQSCFVVCVQEYGLIPLLTGTESSPTTDENGQLNACLLCDEMMSGPGFQYSAGRTRRNSGITSEIDRPDDEFYYLEHHYATKPL